MPLLQGVRSDKISLRIREREGEMESYYGVFRALSLVIVWAIPALLVVGLVTFLIGAHVVALGGVTLRLYDMIWVRLLGKTQAKR